MKSSPEATDSQINGAVNAVTVVDFTDPTIFGETLEIVQQDAVQLASKPFRGRRVIVRLGSCAITFQSTNLPVRTRTTLNNGWVAFVAFGPGASGTLNGIPIRPDRLVACTSEVHLEFVVSAGYESIACLFATEAIQDSIRDLPIGLFHLPSGLKFLSPTDGMATELFAWGRRVTDYAAAQPDLFAKPETQKTVRGELVENLLTTIGSADPAAMDPVDQTRKTYSRIVQLAEDYALLHSDERLYVTDLCRAVDVSERTLQYAFKELMGMTPVAYLKQVRLHRVRQSLRGATHATTTVSKEALRWGFWHFGDFSRAYKALFGELPSDTLRR